MRRFIFWLINIFYRSIEITGLENVPQGGGMIVVSNHPNGIVDPVPLMIKLGRPVAFLAKSTLWAIPVLTSFLKTFNALPIFRPMDDGLRHGPQGDAPARNAETFAKARELLQAGGILALFPEGTTHSDPLLKPLRTGAARIALENEAAMGWVGKVPIVPIGLWYENKVRFRSSVLLVAGESFSLEGYREAYAADARETVRALTERIDNCLDEVVLQAESREVLQALPVVARWLNKGEELSLEGQHKQMQRLLEIYGRLQQTDPDRLETIVEAMRRYDRLLRAMGMNDPWQADLPRFSLWQTVSQAVGLLLLAPLALAGLLFSYIPYRLTGFVSEKAIQDDYTQLSLAKILGGLLFYLLASLAVSIWVGITFGVGWGILLFVVIPFLILLTLWWVEQVRTLAQRFTRGRGQGMKAFVQQERDIVVDMVLAAVEEVGGAF
ncbi:MAG: lysophospholipid acyltransferase family protein [Chloroflexota bacterium]